jgi:hypothetical protein
VSAAARYRRASAELRRREKELGAVLTHVGQIRDDARAQLAQPGVGRAARVYWLGRYDAAVSILGAAATRRAA